jgi:hypothetical protein
MSASAEWENAGCAIDPKWIPTLAKGGNFFNVYCMSLAEIRE